jgi:hypothetical protein
MQQWKCFAVFQSEPIIKYRLHHIIVEWKSPQLWQYCQVGWLHMYICSSTVTTSDHPIPKSSPAKKVVRHCEFSEVWNFGETSCIKSCNWKCLVSEQSYMSARKWSLVVNIHLRVAVGHPFLAVGPPSESTSHPLTRLDTFQCHVGGHSCSPPGALRAHTSNWSHLAEEKSY